MNYHLKYLCQFEDKLLQPDPILFPNLEDRKELLSKHRIELRFLVSSIILLSGISTLFEYNHENHLICLFINLVHALIFLLFCRTRIEIMHLLHFVSLMLIQLTSLEVSKKSTFFIVMLSFVIPIFVNKMMKNLVFSLVLVFCQLSLIHFKFRRHLFEVLTQMTPQDSAQGLIDAGTLLLVLTIWTHTGSAKSLSKVHKVMRCAKIQAEETCSQLNLLLHTCSHEIRNPLNSLLGNLQHALKEKLPLEAFELIDNAHDCGRLLLQLANNILDVKKVQSGDLDVSPASENVMDFISNIWKISRNLIRQKGLNGYIQIDCNCPPILTADFFRLNQVFLNLISNAVKFTDKGGIGLKIVWMPDQKVSDKCFMPYPYDEEDEGLYEKDHNMKALNRTGIQSDHHLVYLSSGTECLKSIKLEQSTRNVQGMLKFIIQDTGCGIQKEDLSELFTQFSQVNKDRAKRKTGSGLGLYIAKNICENMGGEIRVFSKVDVGTTFVVCIPLRI